MHNSETQLYAFILKFKNIDTYMYLYTHIIFTTYIKHTAFRQLKYKSCFLSVLLPPLPLMQYICNLVSFIFHCLYFFFYSPSDEQFKIFIYTCVWGQRTEEIIMVLKVSATKETLPSMSTALLPFLLQLINYFLRYFQVILKLLHTIL